MGKELSETSLEELWELFPISLVAPNDKWNACYDEIGAFLKGILADCPVERISHIGSTAVSGIWAKDIDMVHLRFITKWTSKAKRVYAGRY